jgi:molybdopterin-containing oxidoreductase family iron-sulfur binding subunit
MDRSRRDFLERAGLLIVGFGCGLPAACSTRGPLEGEPNPEMLKGKRWALLIDIQRCQRKDGCTACMDVCHRIHNVPTIEGIKEEIKWIWKEGYPNAFPDQVHEHSTKALVESQVPVLCNHCDNAPCVRVCPTQATWKREDGVVMMDMHRCIGCRYCVVACPYGSRSFNFKDPRPHIAEIEGSFPTRSKGVVEKCNLCAERIAVGQEPACVEACQRAGVGAMIFGDLGDDSPGGIAARIRGLRTIRRRPSLGTEPRVYYVV